MNLERALKKAIETGDVVIGSKETLDAVEKKKAKLVVLASNCPSHVAEKIKKSNMYIFQGTGVELGTACGKPFSIAALAVLNPGDSEILGLARKK
jgi:large subunit ribosomal protein L30e